jgi:hypothetical protein
MASNDWHRSMRWMNEPPEDDDSMGVRLMLARQQAASLYEARKFIEESRRWHPNTIAAFIDGLDASAQANYERMMAVLDASTPHYQDWLQKHRHVTAHFPKLHPKDDELAGPLAKAAPYSGTITVGNTQAETRFGFADAVSLEFLPSVERSPDESGKVGEEQIALWREEIKKLSDAVIALWNFFQPAVDAYMRKLPPGVVRAT